jgi:DNA-binding GntR family transcriptional regulator
MAEWTEGAVEGAAQEGGTGREALPRHVRVRRVLEERIAGGGYPPGSLLPTELQLASEFGASRFTIRTALRTLTELGYLERRQGVGTRVLSARPAARYSQSLGSLEELLEYAGTTWYVLHERGETVLTDEQAARLGAEGGEVWCRLAGVRWTEPGGRPLSYIESFVPARYREACAALDPEEGPFFSQLARNADGPIDEVVQEIRAAPMPPAARRSLGQRPGSWSLQILRRYLTGSGLLIASFNWHPADHLTYTMRIRRDSGGST